MTAVNALIYQHFRSDEAPVIDELNDLINQAENEYRPVLSHFLNPRELFIAQTLVNTHDEVKLQSFGGVTTAERKRALFFPTYYTPTLEDYQLVLMEIEYPQKFAVLSHGSILGTLVNSGIQREVLGDIITDSTRWQFALEAPLVPFLQEQVTRIGRVKVRLAQRGLTEAVNQISEWEEVNDTVASLRADALVSHFYGLSRKHAKELIRAHKVHLNWALLEKPDYELADYDILSVRGYGRIKLNEQFGLSKKGKLKISAAILKK